MNDEGKTRASSDQARTELEQAAEGDDATRLKVLEELYRTLESELEGDADQAGSPRR